jgi:hypothetical protein
MNLQLRFRKLPSFVFFLALAYQLPSAASELEPDATLEGFPFTSAASVAISADGLDVYAAGQRTTGSSSAGLAWLRRDPVSGHLAFRRNYLSSGADPRVIGVALGPEQNALHVLTPRRLLLFQRGGDGALLAAGETALPTSFVTERVAVSPLGSRLVVTGRTLSPPELLIYDRSPSGIATLRQTLTGVPTGEIAFLNEDLFVSGRALLRRGGAGWTWTTIGALDGISPGAILTSPDRGLVYVRTTVGEFPQLQRVLIALEPSGGQLVEVGRSDLRSNWEWDQTALSVNPESGDLYIASYETNGGHLSWIDRYSATGGGRTFTFEERLDDPWHEYYSRGAKDSLAPSPDGRHLYANFYGEPMALLEIGTGGALEHVPDAAGLHSHFEQPFKVLSIAPREAYLLTPSAVLQARWDGDELELASSLTLRDWSRLVSRPGVRDLALTPGGGGGVLASNGDLVMVERDRSSGALRLLPDTRVDVGFLVERLAISPDGRYVYAVGAGIKVYYLRRDVPKLVFVQALPNGGSDLRISPSGIDAVLLSGLTYFRRSVETGELTPEPFRYVGPSLADVREAIFSRGGKLLHLFRNAGDVHGSRIEVLYRQADGRWTSVDVEPAALAPFGHQALDSFGDGLYRLDEDGLSLAHWTDWYFFPHLEPVAELGNAELGGVGAFVDPELYYPGERQITPLALLPGDNELVVASRRSGNLRLFRRGCGKLAGGPCLADQRFRVEIGWRDEYGDTWPALAVPQGSDNAQIFAFFDVYNWEIIVKVLDGCGINDRFWVYAAASTDVGFDIRVTDTFTGERKVYTSAAGSPAPAITDGAAFATCGAASPGWTVEAPPRPPLFAGPMLLLDNRFEAKVSWTTPAGQQGAATALQQGSGWERSGLFYFFSPDNWEMQVKVLNGCGLNNHYWVLGAATTDVGYELEVFDPVSGLTRNYENIAGRASPAIIDLEAFPCN